MPAAYAHYRFGQDMLKRISPELRSELEKHKSFYDLGLPGPDLLFYYQPLHSNFVGKLGGHIHEKRALDFFRPAGDLLHSSPSPELFAYICGFICHFALDLYCHGYIYRITEQGGPGHNQLEKDFDRFLLEADGSPICPGIRTRHIRPSIKAAGIIAPLFPGLGPLRLYRAMLATKLFDAFLGVRSSFSYGLVQRGMKLFGQADKLGDMLLNSPPDPCCESSCRDLEELYMQAQDTALRLISDFRDSAWGRMNYDTLYEYNFESRLTGPKKERENEL